MLDALTIFGIAAVAIVAVVLFAICKIRDCNKPIC